MFERLSLDAVTGIPGCNYEYYKSTFPCSNSEVTSAEIRYQFRSTSTGSLQRSFRVLFLVNVFGQALIIKHFGDGVNYQFKAAASCGGSSITRVKNNGNNAAIEITDTIANKIPVWSIPIFI